MNISRPRMAVAVLSAIYAFPFSVFATGESTTGSSFTEVSSCSELSSTVDRDVCDHHLLVLQALIREKNSQSSTSTSTPSPTPSPIPETVKIRKISNASTRPSREAFETTGPTLFIFDAERSSGQRQPAIYELQLSESQTIGSEEPSPGNSFELPDNSAFVGNATDILPEFVIEGGIQNHYVMSAPHNDSVYHLANIEIDSRNPLETGSSSTMVPSALPTPTPASQDHVPSGILDLRGAGIFDADNVKVVLDPADNKMSLNPVELGCTNKANGRGAEELFVYRFTHSEIDLLLGELSATSSENAAIKVRCGHNIGHIQLTMRNTRTVISLPTVSSSSVTMPTSTPMESSPPKSSGVLFSMQLTSRENVLSFVDSTCNSIVDQFGNDISVDPGNPSNPDHYMGEIRGSNFCLGIEENLVQGAFGLKDREQAWGWLLGDNTNQYGCGSSLQKTYRAGFASVSQWAEAGVNVACNCPMPTPTSTVAMMEDTSSMGLSFTEGVDQTTTHVLSTSSASTQDSTQVPYASPTSSPDTGALGMNNGTEGLSTPDKVGIGVAGGVLFAIDQAITHTWFHLSNRIKQAWIRYTSQVLATIFGVGIPAVQLAPKCASGLRGKPDKTLL
ncbi:hypothetical protein [Endozoicomonas arenosclerae]|uniref:hypothetical protein n=1 Tax=Endozoicomonas arenosclerae TaxID=1633495 RepID=UPI000785658B|nr:hypothetical protein [Endozoicomonas arenosclerae]